MIVLLMVYHVVETSIVPEARGFSGIDLARVIFGSRCCSCRHCGHHGVVQRIVCEDRSQALYRSDERTL